MQSNHYLTKIILIVALVAVVLLIIGFSLSKDRQLENDLTPYDVPAMSSDNKNLNSITSSSSVESDMDAYLKASDSPSNPNDFNDSYSDLNQ